MSEPVVNAQPVVIKLRSPIQFGSRTVEQLTIRPLKAKDLRRVKQSDSPMQSTLNMASYLTGEVKEVIDELEGDDLGEVLDAVNNFFQRILKTGRTSSEP